MGQGLSAAGVVHAANWPATSEAAEVDGQPGGYVFAGMEPAILTVASCLRCGTCQREAVAYLDMCGTRPGCPDPASCTCAGSREPRHLFPAPDNLSTIQPRHLGAVATDRAWGYVK